MKSADDEGANVALGEPFIYIPAWRQEKAGVDKASDKQNTQPDFSSGRESAYRHL